MHEGASVPDQSKISSLGPIPSEWKVVNLGSVLKELYRYPTYYGIQYVDSGVPEVRGELIQADGNLDPRLELYRHISEQTAARFPRVRLVPDDFVMSVRGTLGKVGIVPPQLEGAVITANLIRLQLNSSLAAPRWAKHLFHSPQFQNCLDAESSATTIKTIQAPTLEQIPIVLPPLLEQSRIAEILDAADEAIQQTERVIAKLKAVKAGLLHDLLTRGLDEHGQLRDPQAHPEQFKDSPLGRIPRVWGVRPLADLADVDRGKFTHRPRNDPAFYGGKHPFIQTGDVTSAEGGILKTYSQTLNERGAAISREFPAGTIAITIAANIADTAILGRPMCFPDSIVGVVVRLPHNVRYVELCIRRAKSHLDAQAPQSAQKNINLEVLRPLLIAVPTPAEQKQIAAVYDAHDARIRAEEAELVKLRQVKRGLMDDLLTGKVRVASE